MWGLIRIGFNTHEAKRQTPDNAHRNVPMSEEEILVGVGDASLDAVSVTGGGKELSLVW